MNRFEKLRLALRYYLLGKGYMNAADALEFAASYHTGLRKDGVTPEYQHQIEIAHYIRTLPDLIEPEATLAAALLHDVKEDYNVTDYVIRKRYGEQIADACELLDKNGKTETEYFKHISVCPIASIVKGADRIHNLQSMVDVFSREKQRQYIEEVQVHFLPMIKSAKRSFVAQEAAYENIKHLLKSQVQLIEAVHRAQG